MSFSITTGRWYQLNLQPESWEVGAAYASRRGGAIRGGLGPSAKVEAFEAAVREELESQQPTMQTGDVSIKIFLWRQLGHRIKKADATNMQKAIEDAMQGVVIENDRNVRSISTEIMEQDVDVDFPRILVNVAPYTQTVLPSFMHEEWFRPKDTRTPESTSHYTDGVF